MDTRVGCYGVVIAERRILLAHWREGARSGWTLPGGGMEVDETPEQTARREVREETGFDVELEELLGLSNHYIAARHRPDGGSRPLHGLRVIYRARITGGALTVEENGSTDDAAWFDLTSLGDVDRVPLVDEAVTLYQAARRWRG
jgi:ADP-ribose pyrophosphatase YjhB (NUDIX family)